MHIRTFKAKVAKLFRKANPGWEIGETTIGPNRFKPATGNEAIVWRVWVQKGDRKTQGSLRWSDINGFWMQ